MIILQHKRKFYQNQYISSSQSLSPVSRLCISPGFLCHHSSDCTPICSSMLFYLWIISRAHKYCSYRGIPSLLAWLSSNYPYLYEFVLPGSSLPPTPPHPPPPSVSKMYYEDGYPIVSLCSRVDLLSYGCSFSYPGTCSPWSSCSDDAMLSSSLSSGISFGVSPSFSASLDL